MKTKFPFMLAVVMLLGIFHYDFSNEIGSYKFWILIGEIIVFIASILFLIFQKGKILDKENIFLGVGIVVLHGILTYDFSTEVGSSKFWIFIGEIILLIIGVLVLIFQAWKNRAKKP